MWARKEKLGCRLLFFLLNHSEGSQLATGSQLQPLLLMLFQPLQDLLSELLVWPDLVHGKWTAVERVCLVAARTHQMQNKSNGYWCCQLDIISRDLERSNQPEEMPCYSWAVDCDIGGRQKNGIQHQSGHDGIQELIWGIWICLLFLLLSVCIGLKQKRYSTCVHHRKHCIDSQDKDVFLCCLWQQFSSEMIPLFCQRGVQKPQSCPLACLSSSVPELFGRRG